MSLETDLFNNCRYLCNRLFSLQYFVSVNEKSYIFIYVAIYNINLLTFLKLELKEQERRSKSVDQQALYELDDHMRHSGYYEDGVGIFSACA